MESDFNNVFDALGRMEELVNSVELLIEGKHVEYKGYKFKELPSGEEGITAWLKSFWEAPSEQDKKEIRRALTAFNRDFSTVRSYLNQPEIENIEVVRNQILELIHTYQNINLSGFRPEAYKTSCVAIGELFSSLNHLDTLVELSLEAKAPIKEDKVTAKEKKDDIVVGRLADLILNRDLDEEEIVNRLAKEEDRQALRDKIESRKQGDVVCKLSQGRFPKGSAACAYICMNGAYHVLRGEDFHDEESLYDTINEGISVYGDLIGNQPVSKALIDVNKSHEEKMIPFIPEAFENETVIKLTEYQKEILPLMKELPTEYSYSQTVKEGFQPLLKILKESPCVGVINCVGEVKFVYARKDKFYLFDSHGKSYHGTAMGASVLSFDSLDECNAKLQEELGKDESNVYEFWFVKSSLST